MAEGRTGEFEPVYLTLADVLELHAQIIGATPAEAADQLRNRAGLESAIARPETYAHYQDADLALQASVLAHGIAESQCFIDGNKRTALDGRLSVVEAPDQSAVDAQPGYSPTAVRSSNRPAAIHATRRPRSRSPTLRPGSRASTGPIPGSMPSPPAE